MYCVGNGCPAMGCVLLRRVYRRLVGIFKFEVRGERRDRRWCVTCNVIQFKGQYDEEQAGCCEVVFMFSVVFIHVATEGAVCVIRFVAS